MDEFEYTEGYVAFLDILGFANQIDCSSNDKTFVCCKYDSKGQLVTIREEEIYKNVLRLLKKIREFKVNNDNLIEKQVEIINFSDSVIITGLKLKEVLGKVSQVVLLVEKGSFFMFRGAIVKGKYYCKDEIVAGPAINKAVTLEKEAEESKILIDNDLKNEIEKLDDILFFEDYSSKLCYNIYYDYLIQDLKKKLNVSSVEEIKNKSAEEKISSLTQTIADLESDLIEKVFSALEVNHKSDVIRKFFWRVLPFNYTLLYLLNHTSKLSFADDEFSKSLIEVSRDIKAHIIDINKIIFFEFYENDL